MCKRVDRVRSRSVDLCQENEAGDHSRDDRVPLTVRAILRYIYVRCDREINHTDMLA